MKTISLTIIITIILSFNIFSQEYLEKSLGYQNPDELVTLSSKLPFNQAIALLSKVSERITGKKIISTVELDSAIGIEIKNMNYYKAMVVIVRMADLVYEEKPDVIIIKRTTAPDQQKTKENFVSADAREVKISAVFFEIDINKEKQLGVNWQTLFSREGVSLGGNLLSFQTQPNSTTSGTGGTGSTGTTGSPTTQQTPDFNINVSSNYSIGGFDAQTSAIFKFFETEGAGDLIASPNVTVLDGTEAKLQDGQDISYNTRDFSGNIVQKFYSTGNIVTVTPFVITDEGIKYILLNVHVERSSFVPNQTNTIINKTSADTRIVLLNNEESVIGGMFFDQTTKTRQGIPILKDLPWWFFGLRYLFGYDDSIISKKELVILIKANLVPTLKDRLAGERPVNPLKDELQYERERIKNYQQQNQQSKDQ